MGRGLTLQNLSVFVGVFAMQSASGFIIGELSSGTGPAPESAYRAVFGFLCGVTLVAVLAYLPIRDVNPAQESAA